MAYYMRKPMPQFYCGQIQKTGSLANAVDNFWNNTLPHYFTQERLYGIELEQRPLEGVVNQRSDFNIRCIRNGDFKKVVLMEDKKRKYETQASKWLGDVTQLTRYLSLVRTEQDSEDTLYGAITVETYVRFYYFVHGEKQIRVYPSANTGKAYELKADEAEIHSILTEFVEKTSH